MKIPLRKFYFITKATALILMFAVFGLFLNFHNLRRTLEAEYERQILDDEARIMPKLGANGEPTYLSGREKRLGDKLTKKFEMNVYLSDRIPYNRSLKDVRHPSCSEVVYDAELPSASVVVIFHNEPYSVVIRTVWSVLNSARRNRQWLTQARYVDYTGKVMTLGYDGQDPNSDFVYIKEIILVDDNSTLPELQGKLTYYINNRLPSDMIRIIRSSEHIGLTRARQKGAKEATGDVLVFLDAHCEVNIDWLRPLLQRIKDDYSAVTVPVIDCIKKDTFYYEYVELTDGIKDDIPVGGFNFAGNFVWISVPKKEKRRRRSEIGPIRSPTMAGGLYAIDRAYFWELGGYDEQMNGWGGENLEMSFRVWQCGGRVETIPCSRVGHVFRSFHPYALPAHADTHGINTARCAEVWMDDYKELFYLHRPDLKNNPKVGDVTERKKLREELQCRSFQWYLDNVYLEKFIPVKDVVGYGRIQNIASDLCLDSDYKVDSLNIHLCHPALSSTQYLSLTRRGELRDENRCAEVQFSGKNKSWTTQRVMMVTCSNYPNIRQVNRIDMDIQDGR